MQFHYELLFPIYAEIGRRSFVAIQSAFLCSSTISPLVIVRQTMKAWLLILRDFPKVIDAHGFELLAALDRVVSLIYVTL